MNPNATPGHALGYVGLVARDPLTREEFCRWLGTTYDKLAPLGQLRCQLVIRMLVPYFPPSVGNKHYLDLCDATRDLILPPQHYLESAERLDALAQSIGLVMKLKI